MAIDLTQAMSAEYFGKETNFGSLKNIATAIRNFFYTPQQEIQEETNLKSNVPAIEDTLLETLGTETAIGQVQNFASNVNSLFDSNTLSAFGDEGLSAFSTELESFENLNIGGTAVAAISTESVIVDLEASAGGIATISSIAGEILEGLGAITGYVAGGVLAVAAIPAVIYGFMKLATKTVSWSNYFYGSLSSGIVLGNTQTDLEHGLIAFVKDIGSVKIFGRLDTDGLENALLLAHRDMGTSYNMLSSGLNDINKLVSITTKMQAVTDTDNLFNILFPKTKETVNKFRTTLNVVVDKITSLTDEFFTFLKMEWVKTGLATRKYFNSILSFGTDYLINYPDLKTIADWIQKILDLQKLIDSLINIINTYYVSFLTDFIKKTNILNYVAISTGSVTRPYDPTKDEDKLYDPDKTANPFTDGGVDKILKKILGKITKETSQTVTVTKTITKLKPKTKKPKVKLKKKKLKSSSKNSDPNHFNITTIIRTYEGNIVSFIFDTPSNMNSNSKGTLLYVSKSNMTKKLINVNRGSYSYLTTNEFDIMKVKTVRNISINAQFKAITKELKMRDKYSYR